MTRLRAVAIPRTLRGRSGGPDAMGHDDIVSRSLTRRAIHVAVSDHRGRPLAGGLSRWLADVAPGRARGAVNIAIVSDARVRALNRRYRGIDRTTDVLSFPATAPAPRRQPRTHRLRSEWSATASTVGRVRGLSGEPKGIESFLGDIVIARGVARRQARAAGHGEATEIKVLALHGLLHLLGYDHERDTGAMARLECKLRRIGGLREGLLERP